MTFSISIKYNDYGDNMYASVLVEIKSRNLDKTFTYKIPNQLRNKAFVGMRVLVPFNGRQVEGFILDICEDVKIEYEIKDIIKLVDDHPVLTEEMIKLGEYISKKTLCNLIHAYQTMLPAAYKAHKNINIKEKYITYLRLLDSTYIPANAKQSSIIDILKRNDENKSLLTKISPSCVKTLLNKRVIEEYQKEVYRYNVSTQSEYKKVQLTLEQQNVINRVVSNLNKFTPFLLHGVTGSGKTEVYMNIIDKVLSQGKEVIMLVPEISLTPQMVDIFKSRFKDDVAILHSGLSDGEKYDEYRKIERKEVSIVIGARSAIFAPFTNLGLIVLDEEHSETYKQDSTPRYDTIDVAIKRAKTYNIPLILGSATPSIESYTRAKNSIYELLELKNRINKSMPEIKIIDMKEELKRGNKILSKELIDDINDRLSKDEQVILLLNRRGYQTTIVCKDCGETLKCPNCDIPLTYHKDGNKLNCHYCNYTTRIVTSCPNCKSENIASYGMGTEKLEEEVKKIFNNAKTVRMDIDTTRTKGSHQSIFNDFKNKKYNVLIGTQMISKGLDFKSVTLVGVINGDSTLNIPDFRSGERTFSLLSQVSGRAGRFEKNGKVIIQCFNTTHYSIVYTSKNDYDSFYNEEMKLRKKLKYPPYYNLCLIKLVSKDLDQLNVEAMKVKDYLVNNTKDVIILGPSFSIISKTFNKYNMQILLKYKNLNQVYEHLKFIIDKYRTSKNILIDIDLNPRKI